MNGRYRNNNAVQGAIPGPFILPWQTFSDFFFSPVGFLSLASSHWWIGSFPLSLFSFFCCSLLLSPVLLKKLNLDLLLQSRALPELFSIWGSTSSFCPFGEYPIVPSQAPVTSSEHTKHRLTTFMVVCGSSLKCMKLSKSTLGIFRVILRKSTCLAHNRFSIYLLNKRMNEIFRWRWGEEGATVILARESGLTEPAVPKSFQYLEGWR